MLFADGASMIDRQPLLALSRKPTKVAFRLCQR